MRESESQSHSRAVPHGHPDRSSQLRRPRRIPPVSFPLAVVTGITNLKATIALDELGTLASGGQLVVPCGVTVHRADPHGDRARASRQTRSRRPSEANQKLVALLPPGLVEPATKVLPIAGDGPFGLFGPDLFGDPESRALPYPVIGSAPADGPGALDPAWTAYDASQTWNLTAIGSLCADRVAAYQAVTLGKGWDWPFNGGTATYKGTPFLNPNPPAGHLGVPDRQAGRDGQRRASPRASASEPTSPWRTRSARSRGRGLDAEHRRPYSLSVPEDGPDEVGGLPWPRCGVSRRRPPERQGRRRHPLVARDPHRSTGCRTPASA